MTTNLKEPIAPHWTTSALGSTPAPTATAAEVNHLLAAIEVADIEPSLVPYLAAAAAELALVADVPWRFSVDDPPVALLRMIAKVAIRQPAATGAHTTRLHARLATG